MIENNFPQCGISIGRRTIRIFHREARHPVMRNRLRN